MSPPDGRNGRPRQETAAPNITRAQPARSDRNPDRSPTAAIIAPDSDGGLCDFCTGELGPRPYTRFECSEFEHRTYGPTGSLTIRYRGPWAACRRCAPMVRTRAWRNLASRIINVRRAAGYTVAPDARTEFAALWLAMERRLTGDEHLVKRGAR